jgi:hypothetical protein
MTAGWQARGQCLCLGDEARGIDRLAAIDGIQVAAAPEGRDSTRVRATATSD